MDRDGEQLRQRPTQHQSIINQTTKKAVGTILPASSTGVYLARTCTSTVYCKKIKSITSKILYVAHSTTKYETVTFQLK